MTPPDDELAGRILSELRGDPQRSLETLADSLGEPLERVRQALDEYAVTGDTITHAGPGGGGGWV
jgi:hypothetical protein